MPMSVERGWSACLFAYLYVLCVCVCVRACVRACVCGREGEREREKEKGYGIAGMCLCMEVILFFRVCNICPCLYVGNIHRKKTADFRRERGQGV